MSVEVYSEEGGHDDGSRLPLSKFRNDRPGEQAAVSKGTIATTGTRDNAQTERRSRSRTAEILARQPVSPHVLPFRLRMIKL
jgi:hypothetical protein